LLENFDADFNQIAAAKINDPEKVSGSVINCMDPEFFGAIGAKAMGHKLLLAKGILSLNLNNG